MKHKYLIALFVLVLFALACGAAPEPTPSNTPLPSATIAPSDTPTVVPTSTPDRTATVAAIFTKAADSVLADLQSILKDEDIDYQSGSLLWQQETPLLIELSGPEGIYQEFANGEVVKNFILKSDVTWNATGILVCGFMFRSEPNMREGKQYQFLYLRFSGAPAWAIEFHEFGYYKNSPTKVQYSSAVNLENGATNQLVLIANGGEFTVFINGVRQGKYYDNSKQMEEGYFAALGTQDSGEGSCEYENTYVWELK
ncbi:MAG: hypothetical protein U0V18_01015 [Anaerolineales bacterium]